MSNASDFIIENGVLKKYVGPGGSVVIPEGVRTIERFVFDYETKEITIPPSVKKLQLCCLPRDITVYGKEGSAADVYVQKYGGTFVATFPATKKKPLEEPKGKVSALRATALLEDAILSKNIEAVRNIVKKYAPFELGARALGLAVRTGCLDIVSFLLDNKFSFAYSTSDQKLIGKYALVYKPSSNKFWADFALLGVVSDIWNRYLFGYMEKSFQPEKLQLGWDLDIGVEKVISPIPENLILGASQNRAEVLTYLIQKKKLSAPKMNLMLYYSILEDDAQIIDVLGAGGAVVDVPWLDVEKYEKNHLPALKRFLAVVTKKDIEVQKRIFSNLNKYMRLAYRKFNLRDHVLEKIPYMQDGELAAIILENADVSNVNKQKCLSALLTRGTDAVALSAFLDAGFCSGSQIDKLIQQAGNANLTEHKIALLNYKHCSTRENRAPKHIKPILPAGKHDDENLFVAKKTDTETLCIQNYTGEARSITIPAQIGGVPVSTVGEFAFSPNKKNRNPAQAKYLLSVVHITIPEGVETIGREAFSGCKALNSIVIPASIKKIGDNAFKDCNNLESVDAVSDAVLKMLWDKLSTTQKNKILLNKIKNDSVSVFIQAKIKSAKKKLIKLGIENDDAELISKIFSHISKPSIETMDEYLQMAIRSVQVNTFLIAYKNEHYSSTELDSFEAETLDKELGVIERTPADWRKIFAYKVERSGITISSYKSENTNAFVPQKIGTDSVVAIAEYAFSPNAEKLPNNIKEGRKNLTSVTIADGIKRIGRGAFCHCTHLAEVTLPDSVTNIAGYAFYNCAELCEAHLPDKLKKIGEHCFEGCTQLKEITIPLRVKEIAGWAFCGCTSIRRIVVPANVTEIGVCAFSSCSALEEAIFPENMQIIKGAMFYQCINLKEFHVPENVTAIEVNAFLGCKKLAQIHIGGKVTQIHNTAFLNCPNLTLYAPAGSYAETYAKENNIPFVAE